MVLHKTTGKTYKDRKEAKEIIGSWQFKKAARNAEIIYCDDNFYAYNGKERIYNTNKGNQELINK